MPDWDQWVFSFLSLLGLWAGTGAIGFPLGLVLGPLATFACSVLLFPILLLSAMEADSFLIPYSPPVLLTLVRHWRTWASFYVITLTIILLFSAILELGHSGGALPDCAAVGPSRGRADPDLRPAFGPFGLAHSARKWLPSSNLRAAPGTQAGRQRGNAPNANASNSRTISTKPLAC